MARILHKQSGRPKGSKGPYQIVCAVLYGIDPSIRYVNCRVQLANADFCRWLSLNQARLPKYLEQAVKLGMIEDLNYNRKTTRFRLVTPFNTNFFD